jgi:hypothetical protein
MRRVLRAGLLSLALATVVAVVHAPTAQAGGSEESAFVSRINAVRGSRGLGPLEVDGELTAVARNWAATMASGGDIWHNPNLAGQVSANWVRLGENVGVGFGVDGLMDAFINSAAHYANIVGDYTHVGVGVVWGGDGRMYTAHVFMSLGATPAPAPEPAPRAERQTAPAPADDPAPEAEAVPEAPAPPPPPPPPPAEPARVATVLAELRAFDA